MHRLFDERIRPGSVVLSAAALLLAACGGGGGSDGGGTSPPPPPPPPPPAPSGSVTISGTVAYEFVPPNLNCQGLDFASTAVRPIRGATVQLVDLSSRELGSTVSGEDGSYSFADIEPNLDVRIRVRAELKKSGSPSWDVEVRDNVLEPGDTSPPALVDRPLYAIVSDFNTGSAAGLTRNLTARTGWDASAGAYTGTRAAAPFAVLDSIYTAMQLILSVEPNAVFSPLDAYWSVNNTIASPSDIDAGDLGASFYTPDPDRNGIANPSLFLLGDAAVDTEEFDDHVIVHEWGHYFEDNFARSDSTGGPHGVGDKLDARLAFGEGWATALSGIALENPIYCDTGPAGTSGGFGIGTEKGAYDAQGWYDEISVLRFIYDLWDTTDDEAEGLDTGADTGSIGFAPIYETMVGPQAFTETFTTVFSFASELRSSLPPADQAFLDSQLVREDMTPGFDKWGAGELNDASPDGQQSRDVLPLYVDVPMDGTVVNICSNDDFDGAGDGNKLATFRYLRLNVAASSNFDVRIVTTTTGDLPPDDPLDERDQSDPDMFIVRNGRIVAFGNSGEANEELFSTGVLSGPDTYVADLREFRYADPESPVGFPDRMCFDVSFTPVQ
ncbi:MAG TPA: carboxypeptidase-like regulatory domain-containing protein [Woeseiaceae bacterium]|nr:carboxypeptidase-like regulatory domain-containing protein [Woeseiaceae bacterium]